MEASSNPQRFYARPYHDISTPFSVDEKGTFAEFVIGEPSSMPELAIGANILIIDQRAKDNIWIGGRIVGLRAISPFKPDRENMLFQDDESSSYNPDKLFESLFAGPHNHQPMVIRVQLDSEMEPPDEGNAREYLISPVQRPPSARSRLFFPSVIPVANDPTPALKDILQIKSNGILLGMVGPGNVPLTDAKKNLLEYRLDINELDNKHMFVVGESGSGKTVFLKNLAYEIRKINSSNRVILTDVQGDITQLLLAKETSLLSCKYAWQREYLKNSPTETTEAIDGHLQKFQLVIPAANSKRGRSLSPNANALIQLAKSKGINVEVIGLRFQDLFAPSDVEYLFRTTSLQAATLLDRYAEWLKPKKSVTLSNLEEEISKILNANPDQDQIKGNKTSYSRLTFEASLRIIENLRAYFDYHQPSLDKADPPLDCFNFSGTTILFLNDLNLEERIMWEMQLVKWLNDNNERINSHSDGKSLGETFVFFDEAHQIIPARPIGLGGQETFARLRGNFERLAREGRKYGINLILSTQSPKDLHEIVPDQCPNRVVMKINPRNAPFAFLDPELAPIASRFSHGQFWFLSPFNGTPNWLRIHSVAPPIPHEKINGFWKKIRESGTNGSKG